MAGSAAVVRAMPAADWAWPAAASAAAGCSGEAGAVAAGAACDYEYELLCAGVRGEWAAGSWATAGGSDGEERSALGANEEAGLAAADGAGAEGAARETEQCCELPGLNGDVSAVFHLKYKPARFHNAALNNTGVSFVTPKVKARSLSHSVSLFQVAVLVT